MLIHQVSITKNNGQVSTCHTFTHLAATLAMPKVNSERKRKAAVLSINQGSQILNDVNVIENQHFQIPI